jgi:hypothetical protein
MELKNLIVMLMFLLVAASIASAGEIIYVDDDASAGGDGTSWAAAFKYLQDALAAADANDEIRVAQGTYIPDQNSVNPGGSGDRLATFQLISGVAVYGGYAGFGEPDPNDRDVEAYETILSGDLAGNDVPVANPDDLLNEPTRSENSYHVVTGSGTDETVVLDGFTITGGNANGSWSTPQATGGGVRCYDSRPTLTNCMLTDNSAVYGGGIHSDNYSNPTLINCRFSGNWASQGGGMKNDNYSDSTLINCTFSGNWAGQGGGMKNENHSDSTLINCKFSGNWAGESGGGMHNGSNSFPNLIDCIFRNNSADWIGGGIYNYPNNPGYSAIINCIFIGNIASERGGATFEGHCASPEFVNCTFYRNSADSFGGGIDNYEQSVMSLADCVLWANSAEEGPQISLNSGADVSISYCDIQGGKIDIYGAQDANLDWGDGNIDADPLFADADNDDYHLQWDSPCINAGDPNYNAGENERDIDGEPRVMVGRVDMGADEVGEKQADFTRNGIINFEDFAVFSQSWLSSSGQDRWYLLCDLYEDDEINISDLAEFANDWLWQADWYEP